MITTREKEHIARLIQKYAGGVSTEALLGFVADHDGMLDVCNLVVAKNRADDRDSMAWLDSECHARKVDIRAFLAELERILAIFKPDRQQEDYFAVLGLEMGAGREEIKKAYRLLSKKFHPDANPEGDRDSTDEFVRITKAYHALVDRTGPDTHREPPTTHHHWRHQKTRGISTEKKRKSFTLVAMFSAVLVAISIIAANNYKNRAMISGLQNRNHVFASPEDKGPFQKPVEQTGHAAGKENTGPVVAEDNTPVHLRAGLEPNRSVPDEKFATARPVEKQDLEKIIVDRPHGSGNELSSPAEISNSTEGGKKRRPSPDRLDQPDKASPALTSSRHLNNEFESGKLTSSNDTRSTVSARLGESGNQQKQAPLSQKGIPVREVPTSAVDNGVTEPSLGYGPAARTTPEGAATSIVADSADRPMAEIPPVEKYREPVESSAELSRTSDMRGTEVLTVQEIEKFLAEYRDAYTSKNLLLFSRFFSVHARENGKPLAEVIPAYSELFKVTNELEYSVEILDWRKNDTAAVNVRCRFFIKIAYKNDKKVNGNGIINFLLAYTNGDLLVDEINYEYN